ncbi:MAG: ATP-binding protein [Acidimicrobiales bacterium]
MSINDRFPGSATPMVRSLAASVRANVPAVIWGDPGTTKTAVLNAYGGSWGYHVETVVGSNREPTDFMGYPIEVDGETTYSRLSWTSRLLAAEKSILFLDELTTCAPSVQRVMLRILQERFVGDTELTDNVAIVGAANPPETAVDGYPLAPAVANRCMHLDRAFSDDAWFSGFVGEFAFDDSPSMESMLTTGDQSERIKARSTVLAFLKTRPDLLHQIPADLDLAGRGWPSRRSWDNLGKVLTYLHPDDTEAILLATQGCVGEAAAIEFTSWMIASDLYDPMEVIEDPSIVDWTVRPDRVFALMSAVVAVAVMKDDKDVWVAVMNVMTKCAESGRPDLAYPGARTLFQRVPAGAKVPAATSEAFSGLLEKIGRWAA